MRFSCAAGMSSGIRGRKFPLALRIADRSRTAVFFDLTFLENLNDIQGKNDIHAKRSPLLSC